MAVDQPTQNLTETWKPVLGYEGIYEVSDIGSVRSLDRIVKYSNGREQRHPAKILKAGTLVHGYPTVCLAKNGTRKTRYVHSLVLESFVGERPIGMEACHRDDVSTNNRLTNLRWDTPSSNRQDIVRNGNNFESNKTHCPRGHKLIGSNLSNADVKRGKRVCRSCSNARTWMHLRNLKDESLMKLKSDEYYFKYI